jgi:hypothetical protein
MNGLSAIRPLTSLRESDHNHESGGTAHDSPAATNQRPDHPGSDGQAISDDPVITRKVNQMNRQLLNRFRMTVLIGGTLFGAAPFAVAGAPAAVTGSHHYTRSPEQPAGIESLDLQVVVHADGTVTGEVHNSLRDGNVLIFHSHIRIDCMHFLDDRTVILTGVDVWDSYPEYVGNTVAFIVRDNGQGANAAPDQSTTVYYSDDVGFDLNCAVVIDLIENGLYDFEADLKSAETGNIQIKP